MTQAERILTSILDGVHAARAQGFMIVTPRGYRLEHLVETCLRSSYGAPQHPDVRRIAPEGNGDIISVGSIRDVQGFLVSTQSAARMKTLVIFRAERMNESAANALLKPLEEPNSHTRILLITDQPSALPATIRSRCAVFMVDQDDSLALAEVTALLAAADMDATVASMSASLVMADGDPWLAAQIEMNGLGTWVRKVMNWLERPGAAVPLPPSSGKTAVPLGVSLRVLQSLMVSAGRGDIQIAGWDQARCAGAAWKVMERAQDIGRAGIDAKARLHSVLGSLVRG